MRQRHYVDDLGARTNIIPSPGSERLTTLFVIDRSMAGRIDGEVTTAAHLKFMSRVMAHAPPVNAMFLAYLSYQFSPIAQHEHVLGKALTVRDLYAVLSGVNISTRYRYPHGCFRNMAS